MISLFVHQTQKNARLLVVSVNGHDLVELFSRKIKLVALEGQVRVAHELRDAGHGFLELRRLVHWHRLRRHASLGHSSRLLCRRRPGLLCLGARNDVPGVGVLGVELQGFVTEFFGVGVVLRLVGRAGGTEVGLDEAAGGRVDVFDGGGRLGQGGDGVLIEADRLLELARLQCRVRIAQEGLAADELFLAPDDFLFGELLGGEQVRGIDAGELCGGSSRADFSGQRQPCHGGAQQCGHNPVGLFHQCPFKDWLVPEPPAPARLGWQQWSCESVRLPD